MNSAVKCKPARPVSCVVIGAGHAGLAVSHCLTRESVDHIILERGQVANSWRHERWDSLRLLTPNWQCRLPGFAYQGNAPDSFMTMPEVIRFMQQYAGTISAPIHTDTTVISLTQEEAGYRVITNQGDWVCRAVVIASGAFNIPIIPALNAAIPASIQTFSTRQYRNPSQLPEGGVLVVGASATGVQLADEIRRSGRPVTLAAGEHVRLPRHYRGRDILWWMEQIGLSDERYDQVDDLHRVRHLPSPQLAGTPDHSNLDLNTLAGAGVRLVGRLSGIHNHIAQFSGSLANVCKLADLKMQRLLNTIDQWIETHDTGPTTEAPDRPEPLQIDRHPQLTLDLSGGEIKTVIWATGFRPDYSWLKVPVLDRKGRLIHEGGITCAPGLYAMGLPFMRRRKSSFIHGAADDARDICAHLKTYLDQSSEKRLISSIN